MTSLPFRTSSMRADSSALAWEMLRTTISIKDSTNQSGLVWSGLVWVPTYKCGDLPKGLPIAIILAYTILPDRAATVRERWLITRQACAPGRGSDWGFTAVHFYVARPSRL